MIRYRDLNEAEKFFIDCLNEKLDIKSAYNMLPSTICFSYCMNEISKIFHLYNESNKKINHFYLCEDFYEFLCEDTVLKSIDEAQYYVLLKTLKSLIGGSVNYKECEHFFTDFRSVFANKYFEYIFNELFTMLKNNAIDDFEKLERTINTFINEILFQKCSYLFLCGIYRELKSKELFGNLYDFLFYLTEKPFNEKDNITENIEMYLPLKNVQYRDVDFVKKKQNVELIDGAYYCKVYSNGIDYFHLCEVNMRRIESIFNIFRFNRETSIDFDYSKDVIIKRKKLGDEFKFNFKQLVSYKYFIGKAEIIDQTINSLNILNKHDNPLYYKFNNILNYTEKDNDFLTVSSFVDNWIALESLIKLSESHVGFDGVAYIVPKLLSIKYLRQEINVSLKKAFTLNKNAPPVQEFINKCVKEKDNTIIDNCISAYYKYKLNHYVDVLSDFKKLKEHIVSIECRLKSDLARIYLVRNEYVHSSNLATYNNMQKFKLKRILSDCIDTFTKSLNGNVNVERFKVSGEDVFGDMMRKRIAYDTTIDIMCGKYKLENQNMGKKSLITSLDEYEILKNIIFERVKILNPNNNVRLKS